MRKMLGSPAPSSRTLSPSFDAKHRKFNQQSPITLQSKIAAAENNVQVLSHQIPTVKPVKP